MIVTVTSFKGGVGKSTTAFHLAAHLASLAPTALVDGDPNRTAIQWAQRGTAAGGPPLPFEVVDEKRLATVARRVEHLILDTEARPNSADIKELVAACDLLIVPSSPDGVSLEVMLQTIGALQDAGAQNYRGLLTLIPPHPSTAGAEAMATLLEAGVPMLRSTIRRTTALSDAGSRGVLVRDPKDARNRTPEGARAAWADYVAVGEEAVAVVTGTTSAGVRA